MSRHRWFQLSLKSLFLLTLLVATFFAGYTLALKQVERERRHAEMEAQRQAAESRRLGSFFPLVSGPSGFGLAFGDFDGNGRIEQPPDSDCGIIGACRGAEGAREGA